MAVQSEHKAEKEEKRGDYRRIERSYGSFSRSFSLSDRVDQKTIASESKDGVLHIALPKTAPLKPKTGENIPVK